MVCLHVEQQRTARTRVPPLSFFFSLAQYQPWIADREVEPQHPPEQSVVALATLFRTLCRILNPLPAQLVAVAPRLSVPQLVTVAPCVFAMRLLLCPAFASLVVRSPLYCVFASLPCVPVPCCAPDVMRILRRRCG